MGLYSNSKGFTFISVILAFSILIITLPFLTHLIQTANYKSKYDEQSVMNFFIFIRDETLIATDYDINNNSLILTLHTGEVVTISQFSNLIRRRLDLQGHEIYLRNIEHMELKKTRFGFDISITTEKGERYERAFTFYK